MLDRSKAPKIVPIGHIAFPHYVEQKLCGSIPTTIVSADHHEVVKIELVFGSGRVNEDKKLAAKYTNMLLKSGTATRKSAEINEHIEYYGATISQPVSFDFAGITLYCLHRFALELIPLFIDLIVAPTFPQEELDFFRKQQKSKLEVALSKVDTVAFRQITENLFGRDHPYGYNSSASDHDKITRSDLVDHHQKTYTADNCKIFISGKWSTDIEALLEKELARLPRGGEAQPRADLPMVPTIPTEEHISMNEKVQSAIRIGRPLFDINHPDYIPVYLLHILLGGYFGSRLSRVIREEKGLTYGINTVMDNMLKGGCLLIATEVDKTYTQQTIDAIHGEIQDLINHGVDDDELQQMISYLKGYLLSSIDGVFKTANVIKGLTMAGTDVGYLDRLQAKMETITPREIQEMARRYLQRQDLWQVVVG